MDESQPSQESYKNKLNSSRCWDANVTVAPGLHCGHGLQRCLFHCRHEGDLVEGCSFSLLVSLLAKQCCFDSS